MRRSAVLVAAAAFLAACSHSQRAGVDSSAREAAEPPPQEENGAGDERAEGGGSAARAHFGIGGMGSLFGGGEDEELSAPYQEPVSSEGFAADEDHYAILELSQAVVELRAMSIFGVSGIELRRLVEQLDELAHDEEVDGLVLRLSEPFMALSTAEELRGALEAFGRDTGGARPVLCHTDRASMITYYILTACDDVALAPAGEVSIPGVAATPIHIRGLLDKLGVRPQFLQIGDHKGAGEALTRESPSPEQEATIERVLDNRFRALVEGIAEGRDMPPQRVRRLIDTALHDAESARDRDLVDVIAPFSVYRDRRLDGTPWRRVTLGEDPVSPDVDGLMEWLGLSQPQRPRGERVAVVHMVGPIVDGDGRGRAGLREEIASRRAVSALRVLAEDDAVEAVVVRIDSPGGSAQASEKVWRALRELAQEKPVIASMGPVAASGGYYIASAAHRIYALETSLTGSIGVAGGKLVLEEGFGRLGITAHPTARGERALLGSPFVAWDGEDEEIVRSRMRDVYRRFVGRVATGRDMPRQRVLEVAGGRLWTGRGALERGLVDELGGLDDALAAARDAGGVDPAAPIEVYPPEPSVLDILVGGGVSAPAAAGAGAGAEIWAQARSELGAAGGELRMPELRTVIRLLALAVAHYDAPVTATSFAAESLR